MKFFGGRVHWPKRGWMLGCAGGSAEGLIHGAKRRAARKAKPQPSAAAQLGAPPGAPSFDVVAALPFDIWERIFDALPGQDILRFGAACAAARDAVDAYAPQAYGPHITHRDDLGWPQLTFDKWRFEALAGIPRPITAADLAPAQIQADKASRAAQGGWSRPQRHLLALPYRDTLPSPACNEFADLLDATGRPMEAALCRRAGDGAPQLMMGLRAAMRQSALAAVQFALAQQVDVDTIGLMGRTRLLWAAEMGDEAVVRCLMQAGADPAPRSAGVTAWTVAHKHGQQRCATLLASYEKATRAQVGTHPGSAWAHKIFI